MSKVLVTGADGFIGSHLVEILVRDGFEVRALALYQPMGSHGWLDRCDIDVQGEFEVVSGDIRDPRGVRQCMIGCDGVLNLAALIGIPYSYQSPDSYVATNILGTLNVLEAARDLGTERVIQTSTSEVYGTAKFVPMNEDHPLHPQSPYAASKVGADQLALSYQRSFGVPVTILRPFNTYGPRQSMRAIIPTVIGQVLSREGVVRVGALAPTRDFSYVTDTALGFVQTLVTEGHSGEVINLGSGFEVSVQGIIDIVCEITGETVDVHIETERLRPENSEVNRLYADNTKASDLLNWSPAYDGLEGLKRGIAATLEWFSAPENMEHSDSSRYHV